MDGINVQYLNTMIKQDIFSQLNGVSDVISGYTGGDTKNPTYEDICTGDTEHAEVCKIIFDSKIILCLEASLIKGVTKNEINEYPINKRIIK